MAGAIVPRQHRTGVGGGGNITPVASVRRHRLGGDEDETLTRLARAPQWTPD